MSVFSKVSTAHPPYSTFNLSYSKMFDCRFADLIPVMCDEVVPGDTWKIGNVCAVRFLPQLAPFFQTIRIQTWYFFVPYRLLGVGGSNDPLVDGKTRVWEEFITGGRTGDSSVALPKIKDITDSSGSLPFSSGTVSLIKKYSFCDYLGLPLGLDLKEVMAYPVLAYAFVYNTFFTDENFSDAYVSDDAAAKEVLSVNMTKDYFMSALPWQQRGDPVAVPVDVSGEFDFDVPSFAGQVGAPRGNIHIMQRTGWGTLKAETEAGANIPLADGTSVITYATWPTVSTTGGGLGATSYIKGSGTPTFTRSSYTTLDKSNWTASTAQPALWTFANDKFYSHMHNFANAQYNDSATPNLQIRLGQGVLNTVRNPVPDDAIATESFTPSDWISVTNPAQHVTGVPLELPGVAIPVSDLRLAFQLQKFEERSARGGYRYTEWLRSMFNVSPRDDRMQRPEYIGGSSQNVVTSEVLQTSATGESGTAQGNMAGHSMSVGAGRIGRYHATEFGLIIGLMSIRPKAVYHEGVDRQWMREVREDFYNPLFANLSEQGIFKGEVVWTGNHDVDFSVGEEHPVFAFQGIYNEMRHKRDMVCADLRPYIYGASGSDLPNLPYWSQAISFASSSAAAAPSFNKSFISAASYRASFNRPFTNVDIDARNIVVNFGNILKVRRPMPYLPEPGLVDHH